MYWKLLLSRVFIASVLITVASTKSGKTLRSVVSDYRIMWNRRYNHETTTTVALRALPGRRKDEQNNEDSFDPTKHRNWKLFDTENCGTSNTDRIIGGFTVAMGSYPWLARLGFYRISAAGVKSPNYTFRCGGALITPYYVLTAAHCALTDTYLSLEFIRLGEFNTETDPDCDSKGRCADKFVDYQIAETISNVNYGKPSFQNDVCLLRTNKEVKYTDYIQPICMTMGPLLKKDFLGETAEVAGWGVENLATRATSKKLQALKVPIVELDICATSFGTYAEVAATQMCAGGNYQEDSCAGDSGGPLMKVEAVEDYPPRYYVIGVVSFGARNCATSDVPAIYTNLAYFQKWILDNMKP